MKLCEQCLKPFRIDDEDKKFYKKLDVSEPTFCPFCREQRRLVWRNEWSFYHRKCDLTGKQIISYIPSSSPYKVYAIEEWYSDKWDRYETGQEFDFKRPFFEQFDELLKKTPLIPLLISEGENDLYTNYSLGNKNCYLISAADYNEDCFYSGYIERCKNCCDCFFVSDSERCYECIDCEKCYECLYCQYCKNCINCIYCFDCQSCENCLGCTNLKSKKYCMFNEQLTKEEYKKRFKELKLTNETLPLIKKKVEQKRLHQPHRFAQQNRCENVIGNNLVNCKNCSNCYDLIDAIDCKNVAYGIKAKDCMDVNGAPDDELLYECVASPQCYNTQFSAACWVRSSNLKYCYLCRACENCFGCVSLHKAKYCILNKQYNEQEYNQMMKKIKLHMIKTGEAGQYFPINISPFSYNETAAQDFYPIAEDEAYQKNWKWKKEEDKKEQYQGPLIKIPSDIKNIDNSICNQILTCETTGKNYKIIPQELKFYKSLGVPIPTKCMDQRHKDRLKLRNPRKLWSRKCDKCGEDIKTSYSPDRKEIIYCEECYLKEVY